MSGAWDRPRIVANMLAFGVFALALLAPRLHRDTVTVDTTSGGHEISPLIYGLAHAGRDIAADLRLGLNRWGGNPNSRYNWEINAWNHARDWKFSNYGDPKAEWRTPGLAADRFVEGNRRAGAATLLTIPTIGWVAKDVEDSGKRGHSRLRSLGEPLAHQRPVTATQGCALRRPA
jgi:hypothetical protein